MRGNRDQGSGNKGRLTLLSGILASCLLLPLVTASAQQAQPWKEIPVPPLHPFKPQQPKRIELKNGIVLFLQEDHELPFVSGSVLIPGGSRDEDPAKVGLIDLYGQSWRTTTAAAAWDGRARSARLRRQRRWRFTASTTWDRIS